MTRDLIYANVVLRAFEAGYKRRRNFRYWSSLERTQWLGRAELQDLQMAALQRLLGHAQQHCPYFRETWRRLGLDAALVRSLDGLRRWPLVDRETIRAHRLEMRAQTPGLRMISKATGGSTGVPLQFDLDAGSLERRMAATYRGYGWAKAGPGTRQFYLWGTALGNRAWWQRSKDAFYDRLYRRQVVSAFELSEAAVPSVVARLNRYKPEVIVAYTNPLHELARMLDERHLVPYAPRSIVVGAEKLHDFQRALIERVFRAPVFETYGSREFMLIGAECERHQGLHLTSEQLLLEIVDDDGRPTADGEEGNVVITDLFNYGMPFVRYLNGDRAVAGFGNCACGRGLPTLRKVAGRQLDLLTTPDGRRLPGELFPHLLKDFAVVRRFQVVQESVGEVVLRLVLARGASLPAETIAAELRKHLGPEMQLRIVEVDDIPLTPSGKLQVVINKVAKATDPPGVEPSSRANVH